MRKSILLAAVTAAMSLGVASANAQLLYSFEPTDSPNSKDGFGPNGITPVSSSIGATVGVGSLKLISPGGYVGTYTTADLPAPLSNPALSAISMDVTISPNDPAYTGTYSDLGFSLFVSNSGLGDYGDQYGPPTSAWQNIDLAPGTYPGVTIPLTGGVDPITSSPISFAGLMAEGWYVSGFQILMDGNAGQTIYVDNVQAVVPEPASLSLIALASGLLLKRRQKI